MKNSFIGAASAMAVALILSGCGGVNLWPFGGEKLQEHSRVPANATAYQCDGGKRFYVRTLDDGAAWLILPDREIRLAKVGDARYSNGIAVLEVTGDAAKLTDGSASAFAGCKAAAAS
ncbi:MAG: hypothetical protein PHY45_10065 [Rhodocyclaceae bacterium]|nr:hypothetical protein [Rhodocyclaceae bacterium]